MARMQLCGIKLFIGDDDLGVFMLLHIFVHVLWLVDIACCYIFHNNLGDIGGGM